MRIITHLIVVTSVYCAILLGNGYLTFGHEDKYCAKLKDGLMVVMKGEVQLTSDVILANGTVIKPSGIVIKADGNKIILKENECVNEEGELAESKK